MGIPYLNRFIKENSPQGIHKIHFADLSGKTIVVDIMVYLYKFHSEDLLMSNLYSMISLFRYYKITPIFIFDGKSPPEKKDLLNKRNDEKRLAKEEYLQLLNNPTQNTMTKNKLLSLKKKIVYLTTEILDTVKMFMDAYGVTYITAEGEADPLCAQFVIKQYAYACLTEDMDQFIYGCPRILRYFNLNKETVHLYNLKKILRQLKLTQTELKLIGVVSGTDYNIDQHINLFKVLKMFKRFKYIKEKNFYNWLAKNTNYIINLDRLNVIYDLFNLSNIDITKIIKKSSIINKKINYIALNKLLRPYGFIFLNN